MRDNNRAGSRSHRPPTRPDEVVKSSSSSRKKQIANHLRSTKMLDRI